MFYDRSCQGCVEHLPSESSYFEALWEPIYDLNEEWNAYIKKAPLFELARVLDYEVRI